MTCISLGSGCVCVCVSICSGTHNIQRVCVCIPKASAELFVLSFQRRQAAFQPKRRLRNSPGAKGTPTMIEHNDV